MISPAEQDLDALAVEMLLPASRLVDAVHDRNRTVTHAVLVPLDVVQLRALCVTLAALVPRGDVALDVLSAWSRRAS